MASQHNGADLLSDLLRGFTEVTQEFDETINKPALNDPSPYFLMQGVLLSMTIFNEYICGGIFKEYSRNGRDNYVSLVREKQTIIYKEKHEFYLN